MRWRTTCCGVGAAALVNCGDSGSSFAPPDVPLADSVNVSIQFYDAWSDSAIGVTSWVGLSNGVVLQRTSALSVMVPGRGATLEVQIPSDEYQTGAMYGPASLMVAIPDTVHATLGVGTGHYEVDLYATPSGLGFLRAELLGPGAVAQLALGVRHAHALGSVVLDSIGYVASTCWKRFSAFACDSGIVWVDTAYAGAAWTTTWLAADTMGVATIGLPSSQWSFGERLHLVTRVMVHDSTRRYSLWCESDVDSMSVVAPMRCLAFAWLTGG